jgi:hypothetical protein
VQEVDPRRIQPYWHPVDLLGTARIGAHHTDRREPPGARHGQLDIAKLGQQLPIRAVAPVGHNRLPAETPVALASFQSLGLHALHELKCPR